MFRFILLLLMVSLSQVSQASVFDKHHRSADVSSNYPATLSIGRFSKALVDDAICDWEHADDIHIKTDRGNYELSSYAIAPNAIKIMCDGKRSFFVFNLPAKYLGQTAKKGDVGVWFGKGKDRAGCEGYIGCDKVHILKLYHAVDGGEDTSQPLQDW